MHSLDQNRVVIVFDDETLKLEEKEALIEPVLSFKSLNINSS